MVTEATGSLSGSCPFLCTWNAFEDPHVYAMFPTYCCTLAGKMLVCSIVLLPIRRCVNKCLTLKLLKLGMSQSIADGYTGTFAAALCCTYSGNHSSLMITRASTFGYCSICLQTRVQHFNAPCIMESITFHIVTTCVWAFVRVSVDADSLEKACDTSWRYRMVISDNGRRLRLSPESVSDCRH